MFLLNHLSIIICPHGGSVQHIPTTGTSYRIDGQIPMLQNDIYQIAGCPYGYEAGASCMRVTWLTGSTRILVKGQPVLMDSSVGICMSASGTPQGPAVIAATRSTQTEPENFTAIND